MLIKLLLLWCSAASLGWPSPECLGSVKFSNNFLHILAPVPHLGRADNVASPEVVRPPVRNPDCRNHYFTSSGGWSMAQLEQKCDFFHQLSKGKKMPLWCFLGLLSSRTFVLAPQLERELWGLGDGGCQGAAEVALLGAGTRHSAWWTARLDFHQCPIHSSQVCHAYESRHIKEKKNLG